MMTEANIPYERLDAVLKGQDNWGSLVHAFEALTAMGILMTLATAERAGEVSSFAEYSRTRIAALENQVTNLLFYIHNPDLDSAADYVQDLLERETPYEPLA